MEQPLGSSSRQGWSKLRRRPIKLKSCTDVGTEYRSQMIARLGKEEGLIGDSACFKDYGLSRNHPTVAS